MKLQQIKPADK